MVRSKRKSKRVPVRLRHKIEKRSAEKQRKERKQAKKHPELHRKKPQALNIPNSFPYKDRILSEIEEARRVKAEEQAKRKEEAKQRRKELQAAGADDEEVLKDAGEDNSEEAEEDDDDEMDVSDSEEEGGNSAMAALLASARARAMEYEAQHGDSEDEDELEDEGFRQGNKDTSRKSFDKMFKQVVDAADVVLYVLDARDPNGTRSRDIERQVMSMDGGEKRLILILNKIDLVPPAVLKGWLTYLRRFFPTLPLKASNGAPNAYTFDHKSLTVQGTAQALLAALKSFAHSKQLKRPVTVGVIGYPNVGKSSVINALTGRLGGSSAACPTGAEAGVTTSLREVKLDKKLKLLDSPGIVFPSTDGGKGPKSEQQARLVLLNAVPPKQIDDPISAVQLLLRRFSTSESLFQKLLDVYGIPPLPNLAIGELTRSFLVEVARKRGRLGKGGVPNLESSAVAVIMDWRDGRIQGWIDPPIVSAVATAGIKTAASGVVETDHKEIVGQWMEEFKLDVTLPGDDGETQEVEMDG